MGEITVNAAMTDVRTLAKTPDSNEWMYGLPPLPPCHLP